MTELKAAGEKFERRAAPLPKPPPVGVFSVNYQVRALFEPECKWRLVEEFGPDSFEVQADGKLLFSFGFHDRDGIVYLILLAKRKSWL